MIDSIKHFFNLGNRFYGLEVCHLEGSEHFFLLKLKKHKGELVIEESSHYDKIQDVIKTIETSIPVFLSFNTKGVLTKIAPQSSLHGRALANSLFPNMDEESLYFESYTIKDQNVISIVRKEEVDSYLEELQKSKISFFSISIGLSGLEKIIPFIKEKEMRTHSHTLWVDESTGRLGLQKNDRIPSRTYHINGLEVNNEYILSLGAVLRGFYGVNSEDTNLFETVLESRNGFSLKRSFSLILYLSIGLLLGILLINFMIFSYYHSKVDDLREQTILNESGIGQLKKLRESVVQKESRLEKALATSSSKVSFYLDELAQKIPSSITLEEITYQPLAKAINPTKRIEYSKLWIMVSGMTSNNLEFTQWIGQMERLPWTQNVETMEYDFQNASTSFFHLKIRIEDENEK